MQKNSPVCQSLDCRVAIRMFQLPCCVFHFSIPHQPFQAHVCHPMTYMEVGEVKTYYYHILVGWTSICPLAISYSSWKWSFIVDLPIFHRFVVRLPEGTSYFGVLTAISLPTRPRCREHHCEGQGSREETGGDTRAEARSGTGDQWPVELVIYTYIHI